LTKKKEDPKNQKSGNLRIERENGVQLKGRKNGFQAIEEVNGTIRRYYEKPKRMVRLRKNAGSPCVRTGVFNDQRLKPWEGLPEVER
jgi:hypothetical protein